MSAFHSFINDLIKKDSEFLHSELESLNAILQDGRNYCANVLSEVKKYDKTGKFSVVEVPSYSRRSSTKENAEPVKNVMQVPTKSKRNAFQENNQILDQHPVHDGIIKSERVSYSPPKIMPTVKTEKEDMPAPTQLPPRKKKIKEEPDVTNSRSTRTRSKKTESDNGVSNDETRPKRTRKKPVRYTSKERKDSDVILQNAPITTVELSDSDDASSVTSQAISENNIGKINKIEAMSEIKNTRSTRTKTRNKVETDPASSKDDPENATADKNKTTSKRGRMESDDELVVQKGKEREAKRSKSDSDNNDLHENSKKTNPQDLNIKSPVANKGESKDENKNDVEKDLFTDDESEVEYKTPPQKSLTKNNKKVAGKKAESHVDKLQENLPILDTTVVIEKPKYTETTLKTIESDQLTQNLDTTIVIQKGGVGKQKDAIDPLITDDESEEEIMSPMKLQMKTNHTKGVKPIFSPFDPSPVKKKVEAFERLGAEASGIPTRVTRTKTRAQAKEQKENENAKENEKSNDLPEETQSTVKEKAKFFTPTRFIPKSSSTNKLTHKLPIASMNMSTYNDSILSVKSASALKSSQAEYREREKQRREKEAEALRKRELMIQAQIEEKKRKREEKQLKAQQHREVLEKESLKKVEAQRIKEEKFKKLLAEKEVNTKKQREEIERKRQLAKKRAMEERRKEEQKKLEEQKKADEALKKNERALKMQQGEGPIYLHTKAPLLPTDYCYDSDEAEFKTHKPKKPLWSNENDMLAMQLCMIAAKDSLKNTFFCCQAVTPDLQELFENIDPRKLKRTSSAIWRKPPRYTLMPNIDQDLLENSSEDDY